MMLRSLNQKTAAALPFEAFLDLAAATGCGGVEPRNDLGRGLFDGLPAARAGAMAKARGLALVGLSEVHPFDDGQQAGAIAALIEVAAAAGARTVSLVPRVDGAGTEAALLEAMALAVRLAEGSGVRPLVEPIGFAGSSLRGKALAARGIAALGGPGVIGLVHDSFQHCIAGETRLFAAETGLVHVSGIDDPAVVLDAAQDGQRRLVSAADRCGTAAQVVGLARAGYAGPVSFECTARDLPEGAALAEAIRASFALIEAGLGAALPG